MTEIKIQIPTSWDDITIAQFQEYHQYLKNCQAKKPAQQLVEILSILTDTDEQIIYSLPYDVLIEMRQSMIFLNDEPTIKFKNIVEVKGIKYGFQKNLEKLSLGEWIDLEYYLTNGEVIDNLHYIAAIFYRKLTSEGDEYFDYEIEAYKNVKLEGQAKMFQHNMKIIDMYGTVVFFYHIVNELLTAIGCYSTLTPAEKIQKMIDRVKDSSAKKKLTQLLEKTQCENGVGSEQYIHLLTGIFSGMS